MKILQFGTGRFLRGFIAPIISESNSIVVVQSRENSTGAEAINQQPDGYHVWTRGKQNGETIDRVDWIQAFDRALVARKQWKELGEVATSGDLELVVSNTTAAGLQLAPQDGDIDYDSNCPESFPAKLVALLKMRFDKGMPGLTILPLELVEMNADLLKELVIQQAKAWSLSDEFIQWLADENRWLNNLVDRIVVGVSDQPPWEGEDPLAVVGEPFRMLAIQDDGRGNSVVPDHPMVQWTPDLAPFFLRKVRVLNGLHTAMVAKFLPQGIQTVLQCVTNPETRQWVDALLQEEILPALSHRGIKADSFAADILERFENPFFQHQLSDIANGHASKLTVRIQPTVDDFEAAFGRAPKRLTEVLETNLQGAS